MKVLSEFLETQAALENKFYDFVGTLDTARTVTLRQLLMHQGALARLEAPWLNVSLFERRLSAALEFLASLPPHPRLAERTKRPLIFFQSSPEEEDMQEEARRQQDFFYGRKNRGMDSDTPRQAFYCHTDPMWFELTGSWDSGNRRIRALGAFANFTWSEVYRAFPGSDSYADVYGFRVPDWPKLLGVCNDTATDYLARIIIHDIGHNFLPLIPPKMDSLHNAVMLYALGPQPTQRYSTPWEEVVHRECTDPYFPIIGKALLERCDPTQLQSLQRYLLKRFNGWYNSPGHRKNLQHLWGIKPGTLLPDACAHLRHTVEHMCSDGFARYEETAKAA